MQKKGVKSAQATDLVVFSIIVLGIAEILTQLVVIREFLSVFYGNELVVGILLANWLLISGIGSYAGRYVSRIADKQKVVAVLHMAVAVLLGFYVYVIRNLYNMTFIRGEMVGVVEIFITAFLVLLPVCFITGFSLPLFSVLYSKKQGAAQIGKVYFFDSLSNIIGGLIFSFVLVYLLNSFQVAWLVLVTNMAAAAVVAWSMKTRWLALVPAILLLAGITVFTSLDLNIMTTAQQYPQQEVVAAEDSEYGRFVVTLTGEQLNFYENGMPLFSTAEPSVNEEKVHYAMLQRPEARNVLLVSGGVAGTTHELLKYDVSSVDYVELDPVLIDMGRRFTTNLDSPIIKVHNTDARMFIKQSEAHYDAIILDLPDPSTAQVNRLYTEEAFLDMKILLSSGGVLGLRLSAGENYMNEETAHLNAAVYNALNSVFAHVLVLPGDEAYYLASDAPLSYSAYDDIPVPTVYVNSDYIQQRLDQQRIKQHEATLAGSDAVNTDFRPVAYYYHLLYWLKHFETNYLTFILALLALSAAIMWRIRRITFAVMSAGFAGITVELILIFGFQAIFGYAYQSISLLITSFMIGLALGALLTNRILDTVSKRTISEICILIAVYSFAVPFLLTGISYASPLFGGFAALVFSLLTAAAGMLVGALFPAAGKMHFKEVGTTAGTLYFYDYAGACIGALLVSALLLPLLGMFWVCAIVAALTLSAAVLNILSK
ncbi:fused MFS/spermidine synthase [Candidatus Woesearchaeota archaeon]|nr:fused MFS/spermidine synthase [Candidatus Woesearchaeota archaeon]